MVLNRVIVYWQRRLATVLRLGVVLGALFGATTGARGQTAAEHAAQAHGSPIVDGRNIQPTPRVVQRRLGHHRQMLKAEQNEATGAAAKPPIVGPATPAKRPDGGRRPQQRIDRRDTK